MKFTANYYIAIPNPKILHITKKKKEVWAEDYDMKSISPIKSLISPIKSSISPIKPSKSLIKLMKSLITIDVTEKKIVKKFD